MLNKKVTRWRNSFFHRKCKYCIYCKEENHFGYNVYYCKAKDKRITAPIWSYETVGAWRFCTLFEVKDGYEKPKISGDSTGGESWSWEGYPGTGPSGRQ